MQKLKGIDGKLDDICRELCKERSDWICEKCGLEFPERKGWGIQWSHLWGRRARATRWDMDNCVAHCTGYHSYLGANPHEFSLWIENHLGETLRDQVRLRFNQPKKFYKAEKQEMLDHYKSELDRIKKLRKDGQKGRIEVVNWF